MHSKLLVLDLTSIAKIESYHEFMNVFWLFRSNKHIACPILHHDFIRADELNQNLLKNHANATITNLQISHPNLSTWCKLPTPTVNHLCVGCSWFVITNVSMILNANITRSKSNLSYNYSILLGILFFFFCFRTWVIHHGQPIYRANLWHFKKLLLCFVQLTTFTTKWTTTFLITIAILTCLLFYCNLYLDLLAIYFFIIMPLACCCCCCWNATSDHEFIIILLNRLSPFKKYIYHYYLLFLFFCVFYRRDADIIFCKLWYLGPSACFLIFLLRDESIDITINHELLDSL